VHCIILFLFFSEEEMFFVFLLLTALCHGTNGQNETVPERSGKGINSYHYILEKFHLTHLSLDKQKKVFITGKSRF
jgi:hypothetical protein